MTTGSESTRSALRHAPRGGATLPALALLGTLLLSACTSMTPPYERPAAPVAPSFGAYAGSTSSNAAAADIEWQRFFGDSRLRQLIALALQGNRDLRIAVLAIEQTRAQLQLRDADLWPTVSAGVTGSRQPKPGGGITNLYTAGLTVTAYELDLFGRLRSASDSAAAQLMASEESRRAVQISLIGAVANAYLALQADDELLRVTRQSLDTREASYRLVRLKFDNGAASQLDLRLAESLLEGSRVALAQLTRQRVQDEDALVLLLGQPLPPPGPEESALVAMPALPELPVGLPSEVLLRRPDVRQAEQQLIAANASIGAARAAFFPRITLTGSVGNVSSELSGLFRGGSLAWSFAPALLQPIFDAGRNRANLKLAQVNREIAVAQYERAIQSAFREVADALAGRATLGEQLQAQQAQVRAEQSRLELAELRYRNGASSYLEVLDAQRSLYAAQQAEVQVLAQRTQNGVSLYRVLGGGWSDAKPAP